MYIGSDTKAKQNDDQRFDDDLPIGASATIPQEFVFSSDPVPGPLPRVITGHATARSSPNLNTHQAVANQGKAGVVNTRYLMTDDLCKASQFKHISCTYYYYYYYIITLTYALW